MIDYYLRSPGFIAETGGQICNRADCAVIPPASKAYGPDRRITMCDAKTAVKVIAAFLPLHLQVCHPFSHNNHHSDGELCRVWDRDGIIEYYHYPVTDKMIDRTIKFLYKSPHLSMVFAQNCHYFFRLRHLRKGNETTKININNRYRTTMGL